MPHKPEDTSGRGGNRAISSMTERIHRHLQSAKQAARLMVAHQALAGLELINARKIMGETRGRKSQSDERQEWSQLCDRCQITKKTARELIDIATSNAKTISTLKADDLHNLPEIEHASVYHIGTTNTVRKLLESIDAIRRRKPIRRTISRQADSDRRQRDPLALPREVAIRKGYVPVAGPYAEHEHRHLAGALMQLALGGARVALVGSEIWRLKR